MRSALRRSDACLSNGRTEAKAGDRTAPSAANFRSREVDSELWAEHRTGARTTNTICHCTKRTRRRQAAEHTPCCGSPGRTSAPRRTPMGGRGLERETSDGLDLTNGVTSEIHTASFKFDSRLSHRVGVGARDRRGGVLSLGTDLLHRGRSVQLGPWAAAIRRLTGPVAGVSLRTLCPAPQVVDS